MTPSAIRTPRQGPFGPDPSYYMQAARFVEEGRGLLTNVSLYHDALVPLPQPYWIYPLWPFVLGIAAKAIGRQVDVRLASDGGGGLADVRARAFGRWNAVIGRVEHARPEGHLGTRSAGGAGDA